jgi:hypothetical protein
VTDLLSAQQAGIRGGVSTVSAFSGSELETGVEETRG